MWTSDSDPELSTAAASSSSTTSPASSPPPSPLPARRRRPRRTRQKKKGSSAAGVPAGAPADDAEGPEAEDVWRGAQWEAAWPRHPKPVLLAAEDGGDGGVGRSRSLTDDDLEELKGCADLGFGFSYDEIPELRGTLPALELCYSMSQRLLDDHPHADPQPAPEAAAAALPAPSPPVTNWKISSPGDSPEEVKARLKYWAQAVACTVRLCR